MNPPPIGEDRAPRQGWGATVGTTVALQWLVILVLSAIAGFGWGRSAAISLFCGGAAVAFPNTSLALWLSLRRWRVGSLGVASVMAGELLKMGLTIALLVLMVVQLKPALSWLALIVGVIAALKAQWLALWVTRDF